RDGGGPGSGPEHWAMRRQMMKDRKSFPSLATLGATALAVARVGSKLSLLENTSNWQDNGQYGQDCTTREGMERLAILLGASDDETLVQNFMEFWEKKKGLEAQGESGTQRVELLRHTLEEHQRHLKHLQINEAPEIGHSPESPANLHLEERRLEDALFKTEIRLSQSMRKAHKAIGTFNELKSGVLHLANLVDSVVKVSTSGKLVCSCPRTPPPRYSSIAIPTKTAPTIGPGTKASGNAVPMGSHVEDPAADAAEGGRGRTAGGENVAGVV
ncbi:unnamed protein product, partial [Discosporangium mesarthrocarpum]